MRLEPMLQPGAVLVLDGAASRDEVLAALSRVAEAHTPGVTQGSLLAALVEREAKFPTGTPEGAAFPHALLAEISRTFVVPMLLRPGVRWSTQEHPPQDLVFGIFGSSDTPWEHVRLLARLARVCRGAGALGRLRAASDAAALMAALVEEDRRHG